MQTEMPINYDIEYPALLKKYHELCNQCAAALKLADEWKQEARRQKDAFQKWVKDLQSGRNLPTFHCHHDNFADDLRAIFAPKDGK